MYEHSDLWDAEGWLILDTETTGLNAYKGNRPFLLTLARGDKGPYSFEWDENTAALLRRLLTRVPGVVMHNAKFDMHMLSSEGIDFTGIRVWDTMVMERLRVDDERSYSLDACGERVGVKKDTDFIKLVPTSKVGDEKIYHYDRAPRDKLIAYADQDVRTTKAVYENQRNTFRDWDQTSQVKIRRVVELELKTTPILFEMERRGIRLDQAYCAAACQYEASRAEDAKQAICRMVGQPFVDSRKWLQPIFQSRGLKYGLTEKGNPSFTSEVLEKIDHPLVTLILTHRDALKRGGTYFEGFLRLVGHDGKIHPSIYQSGAVTGRMSCREPNAQNWPTEDTGPYPVRRAFIADPGYSILSIDYSAMELRVGADLANDQDLIKAIVAGEDLHQTVADLAHVPRSIAKNTRFARMYGAGVAKIAAMLKTDEGTVERTIEGIEETSERLAEWCQETITYAKRSPYIWNLYGRRYTFEDKRFAYKAPNRIIQGTCADVLRVALIKCDEILRGKKTHMLIPIHDEICFALHESEHDLIPLLKKAMRDAYTPVNGLRLDVNAAIGPNFCDLEDA